MVNLDITKVNETEKQMKVKIIEMNYIYIIFNIIICSPNFLINFLLSSTSNNFEYASSVLNSSNYNSDGLNLYKIISSCAIAS